MIKKSKECIEVVRLKNSLKYHYSSLELSEAKNDWELSAEINKVIAKVELELEKTKKELGLK